MVEILRVSAFTEVPDGGNPAGVVPDAKDLSDKDMLQIAQEVGYSETAFITDGPDHNRRATIKYFSPYDEVPFCGHATVAAAVVLGQRHGTGTFKFDTAAGPIELETTDKDGAVSASFTSVKPDVRALEPTVLGQLLELLNLTESDLNSSFPPRESYAGNPHPVLVLADKDLFNSFDFSPDAIRSLMNEHGWTGTVTMMWQRSAAEFEARNLFPVGEITEDPATGSAAASFGAYLRDIDFAALPADVVVYQGHHVGRPSILNVHIPTAGGITVSGRAATLDG